MILNYKDWLDSVWSMKKTRQDNNVINITSVISVEYDTELLRQVIQCTIYDKKRGRTMTWIIVKVHSKLKIKLNYHDLSDMIQSMRKTRQDNYVIDCTGVVYVKIRIEVSWLIGKMQSIMKIRQHNDETHHIGIISA